jgi:hypothetical protein
MDSAMQALSLNGNSIEFMAPTTFTQQHAQLEVLTLSKNKLTDRTLNAGLLAGMSVLHGARSLHHGFCHQP